MALLIIDARPSKSGNGQVEAGDGEIVALLAQRWDAKANGSSNRMAAPASIPKCR
jgi:hypothetical protein